MSSITATFRNIEGITPRSANINPVRDTLKIIRNNIIAPTMASLRFYQSFIKGAAVLSGVAYWQRRALFRFNEAAPAFIPALLTVLLMATQPMLLHWYQLNVRNIDLAAPHRNLIQRARDGTRWRFSPTLWKGRGDRTPLSDYSLHG